MRSAMNVEENDKAMVSKSIYLPYSQFVRLRTVARLRGVSFNALVSEAIAELERQLEAEEQEQDG